MGSDPCRHAPGVGSRCRTDLYSYHVRLTVAVGGRVRSGPVRSKCERPHGHSWMRASNRLDRPGSRGASVIVPMKAAADPVCKEPHVVREVWKTVTNQVTTYADFFGRNRMQSD